MATSSSAVKAGRAYVEIFADNSKFDKTLHETEAQFRNWGSQMTQVTGQFLTGVAAYGASLGLTSKLFAEFDESLRTVAATTGNFYGELNKESIHIAEAFIRLDRSSDDFKRRVEISQKAMEALTAQARQLGRDTSFTAKEAADAMVVLARAGMSVAEIQSTIKDSLNLARATGTDAAETATTVVGVLRAFRMEASETQKAVDLLGATVSNSPQNLSDLGSAMKYVGSVSRSLNISLKTTLEDLGTLANFNIRGEQAGTALRNMYLRLTSSLNQKKLKDFFNVNVVDEQTGNFRKFSSILTDIKRRVDEVGMSSVEVATHFKDIFGLRSSPAALAMMSADIDKMRDALADTDGIVQAMSDEMNYGLSGAIKLLISKFQDLQIAVIGVFATPFGDFLNRLGGILNWAAQFIEKHKTIVKFLATTSLYVAGITTAVAGLSFAIGLAVRSMSGLLGMFRKVSQTSFGSLASGLKTIFSKPKKVENPLEIDLKSIDRARESTRYLGENVTILSKATAIAVERFNKLSASFQRIANHAVGFKKATEIMTDSNNKATQSTKSFADNYGKLSDLIRISRSRINSVVSNLISYTSQTNKAYSDTTSFTKGLDLLSKACEKVGARVKNYGGLLSELVAKSRHAINEVFYNNNVMRELPAVYKAAEKSIRKVNETFTNLRDASSSSITSIQSIITLLKEVNPQTAVDKFSTLAASIRTAGSAIGYLNHNLREFKSTLKLTSKLSSESFTNVASIIKLSEAYNKLTQQGGFANADFKSVAKTRIGEMFDLDKKEQELRIKDLQNKLAIWGKAGQNESTTEKEKTQRAKPPKMTDEEVFQSVKKLQAEFNSIAKQFGNLVQSLNLPLKSLLSAMRSIEKVFSVIKRTGDNANTSLSSVKANLTNFYKAISGVPAQAKVFRASIQDVLRDIMSMSETAVRIQRSLRNIGKAFSSIQLKDFSGQLQPLSKRLHNVTIATESIIQLEPSFVAGIARMGEALATSAIGATSFAEALKSIASSVKTLTPGVSRFNKQTDKSISSLASGKRDSSVEVIGEKLTESSEKAALAKYDKAKYANLKAEKMYQVQFASMSRIRSQPDVISQAKKRLDFAQQEYEQKITSRDELNRQDEIRNLTPRALNANLKSFLRDVESARQEVVKSEQAVKSANDNVTVFNKAVSEHDLVTRQQKAQLELRIDQERGIIDSNDRLIASNDRQIDALNARLRGTAKNTEAAKNIEKEISKLTQSNELLTQQSAKASEYIKTYTSIYEQIQQGAVYAPSKAGVQGSSFVMFKDGNGNAISQSGEGTYGSIVTRGVQSVLAPASLAPIVAPPKTLEEQALERYEQYRNANKPAPPAPPAPKDAGASEQNYVTKTDVLDAYKNALASVDNEIKNYKTNNSVQARKDLAALFSKQTRLQGEMAQYSAMSEADFGFVRAALGSSPNDPKFITSEINASKADDILKLQQAQKAISKRISLLNSSFFTSTESRRDVLHNMLTGVQKQVDRTILKITNTPPNEYQRENLSRSEQGLFTLEQRMQKIDLNQRHIIGNQQLKSPSRLFLMKFAQDASDYLSDPSFKEIDSKVTDRFKDRSSIEKIIDPMKDIFKGPQSSYETAMSDFHAFMKQYGGDVKEAREALGRLQPTLFKDTSRFQKWQKAIDVAEDHLYSGLTTKTNDIAKEIVHYLQNRTQTLPDSLGFGKRAANEFMTSAFSPVSTPIPSESTFTQQFQNDEATALQNLIHGLKLRATNAQGSFDADRLANDVLKSIIHNQPNLLQPKTDYEKRVLSKYIQENGLSTSYVKQIEDLRKQYLTETLRVKKILTAGLKAGLNVVKKSLKTGGSFNYNRVANEIMAVASGDTSSPRLNDPIEQGLAQLYLKNAAVSNLNVRIEPFEKAFQDATDKFITNTEKGMTAIVNNVSKSIDIEKLADKYIRVQQGKEKDYSMLSTIERKLISDYSSNGKGHIVQQESIIAKRFDESNNAYYQNASQKIQSYLTELTSSDNVSKIVDELMKYGEKRSQGKRPGFSFYPDNFISVANSKLAQSFVPKDDFVNYPSPASILQRAKEEGVKLTKSEAKEQREQALLRLREQLIKQVSTSLSRRVKALDVDSLVRQLVGIERGESTKKIAPHSLGSIVASAFISSGGMKDLPQLDSFKQDYERELSSTRNSIIASLNKTVSSQFGNIDIRRIVTTAVKFNQGDLPDLSTLNPYEQTIANSLLSNKELMKNIPTKSAYIDKPFEMAFNSILDRIVRGLQSYGGKLSKEFNPGKMADQIIQVARGKRTGISSSNLLEQVIASRYVFDASKSGLPLPQDKQSAIDSLLASMKKQISTDLLSKVNSVAKADFTELARSIIKLQRGEITQLPNLGSLETFIAEQYIAQHKALGTLPAIPLKADYDRKYQEATDQAIAQIEQEFTSFLKSRIKNLKNLGPTAGYSVQRALESAFGKDSKLSFEDLRNTLSSLANVPEFLLGGLNLKGGKLKSEAFKIDGRNFEYDIATKQIKGQTVKEAALDQVQSLITGLTMARDRILNDESKIGGTGRATNLIATIDSSIKEVQAYQGQLGAIGLKDLDWTKLDSLAKIERNAAEINRRTDDLLNPPWVREMRKSFKSTQNAYKYLPLIPEYLKDFLFVEQGQGKSRSRLMTTESFIMPGASAESPKSISELSDFTRIMGITRENHGFRDAQFEKDFSKWMKVVDDQLAYSGLSSERRDQLKSIKTELERNKSAYRRSMYDSPTGTAPVPIALLQEADPHFMASKGTSGEATSSTGTTPAPAIPVPGSAVAGAEANKAGGTLFNEALLNPLGSNLTPAFYVKDAEVSGTRAFLDETYKIAKDRKASALDNLNKAKMALEKYISETPEYNDLIFNRIVRARGNDYLKQINALLAKDPNNPEKVNRERVRDTLVQTPEVANMKGWLTQLTKYFPSIAQSVIGNEVLTPQNYMSSTYFRALPYDTLFPYIQEHSPNGTPWQVGERERLESQIRQKIQIGQEMLTREQARALVPKGMEQFFKSDSILMQDAKTRTETLMNALDAGKNDQEIASLLNKVNLNRKEIKSVNKLVQKAFGDTFTQNFAIKNLVEPFNSTTPAEDFSKDITTALTKNHGNTSATFHGVTQTLSSWQTYAQRSLPQAKTFQADTNAMIPTSPTIKGSPFSEKNMQQSLNNAVKFILQASSYRDSLVSKGQTIKKNVQNTIAKRDAIVGNLTNQIKAEEAQLKQDFINKDAQSAKTAYKSVAYYRSEKKKAKPGDWTQYDEKMLQNAENRYNQIMDPYKKRKDAINAEKKNLEKIIKAYESQLGSGKGNEVFNALGNITANVKNLDKMISSAQSSTELIRKMQKGYEIKDASGKVISTVTGEKGARLVFEKEVFDPARKAANQAAREAKTVMESASKAFIQAQNENDIYKKSHQEFTDKYLAKQMEHANQEKILQSYNKTDANGKAIPLTPEETQARDALLAKQKTTATELENMRREAELRKQEAATKESTVKEKETAYAQARTNFESANQNAIVMNAIRNQVYRPDRYANISVLQAQKGVGESLKNLGSSLQTSFGGLWTGLKTFGSWIDKVGDSLQGLGVKAGFTVGYLKTASGALNLLTFATAKLGMFAKSVLSMLNMQIIMLAVGLLTGAAGNAFNYWRSNDKQRQKAGEEKAAEQHQKETQALENEKTKSQRNQELIGRLSELRKEENLSESEQKEISNIRDTLIQNGFDAETTDLLTRTEQKYVEGSDSPVTRLPADEAAYKKAVKTGNEKYRDEILSVIKNTKDSRNHWWFEGNETAKGKFVGDAQFFLNQLKELQGSNAEISDENLTMIKDRWNEIKNAYSKTGEQAYTPVSERFKDEYEKWNGEIEKKFEQLSKQKGVTDIFDVKAQQKVLDNSRDNINDLRSKRSTNPAELKEAYDNYIEDLVQAIDTSRNALDSSANVTEIQDSIGKLNNELTLASDEYISLLENFRDQIQQAFPRRGADKDIYEIIVAGAKETSVILQAQEEENNIIKTKYKTKTQTEKNQIAQFYKDGFLKTEQDLLDERDAELSKINPNVIGANEKKKAIEDKYNKRIEDLRNATGLKESLKDQEAVIEQSNKQAEETELNNIKGSYQKAVESNEISTKSEFGRRAAEYYAKSKAQQNRFENVVRSYDNDDLIRDVFMLQNYTRTYKQRVNLQKELEKPQEQRDKKLIRELRNEIMKSEEVTKENANEYIKEHSSNWNAYPDGGLSADIGYGEEEFARGNLVLERNKRNMQYHESIAKLNFEIDYLSAIKNMFGSKDAKRAMDSIRRLEIFKFMAEKFHEVEMAMFKLKQQMESEKFKETSSYFGLTLTSETLYNETEQKKLEIQSEVNREISKLKLEYDTGNISEETYNEQMKKIEELGTTAIMYAKNENYFKQRNQLAYGSEDFSKPYETFNQQQNQIAHDRVKKALVANGIDSRYVNLNEYTESGFQSKHLDEAGLEELAIEIDEDNRKKLLELQVRKQKAQENLKQARFEGNMPAQRDILNKLEDIESERQDILRPISRKVQQANRIIQMAEADAKANINTNYLDKMKENQDVQQDYFDKAYYDQQGSAYDMRIAQIEAMNISGNPVMDNIIKMQTAQLQYEKAQMELGQNQQKLATLDQQTELARQNLAQAVANGASEEVQQQLFKKYNQLLGEQHGIQQGMISTFKEMASIRSDFMKSANATERASAGTFKAIEAGRNAGDWQRENSIKQLNFLKQIAVNTSIESDLL